MDAVAVAQSFYNEINACADHMEAQAHMDTSLAKKMAAAGCYRLLVPKQYNGEEVHPQEFVDALTATAKADAAVGWVQMIGCTTGLLSASLPHEYAQAIYGDHPDDVTVGVTAPIGRAQYAEKQGQPGVTVNGRWPFGSGSQIARWICGGSIIYDNGEPRLNKYGQPESALIFFPREEVTIHTNSWDTSGLRGTGSHDFEIVDGWAPEGRWAVLGHRPRVEAPLYRFPTLGLLALGVSAVAVGTAERAFEEFVQLAGNKTPTGASRSLANRPAVQKEVAMAQAQLHSAQALTREYVEQAYAAAEGEGRLSVELKSKLRLAAANNTWAAVKVVDSLYHLGGGTSIYSKSKLQRCFRDVHVTTQHIMVAQPIFEVVGKVKLGLEPNQPL